MTSTQADQGDDFATLNGRQIAWDVIDAVEDALRGADGQGLTPSVARRKAKVATVHIAREALDWLVANQYVHTSGNGAWTHYHHGRR